VVVPRKKKAAQRRPNTPIRQSRSSYELALFDPSNPNAAGARVPDPWGTATVPFKMHSRVSIISDSTGNFDFIFIGRPKQTAVINNGTIGTGSLTAYAGGTKWYYAESTATLTAKAQSWRMVGNGLSITNIQATGTATGSFYAARVPMCKHLYGPNLLDSVTVASASVSLEKVCGVSADSAGYVPVSIENFQEKAKYDVSEYMGRRTLLNNKPISGAAYDFFNTEPTVGDQVTATQRVFTDVVVNSSNAVAYGDCDSADDTAAEGWTCILIRGTGYPVSVPVIEIECFTHWEGVPTVNTTVGGGSVSLPANVKPQPTASNNMLMRAQELISKVPFSTLVNVVKQGAIAYADYETGGLAKAAGRFISNIDNIRRIK